MAASNPKIVGLDFFERIAAHPDRYDGVRAGYLAVGNAGVRVENAGPQALPGVATRLLTGGPVGKQYVAELRPPVTDVAKLGQEVVAFVMDAYGNLPASHADAA